MNDQDWLRTIPKVFTEDALWKMEVYRRSLFAGDMAWPDVTKLMQDRRTLTLSDQLYRAIGAIGGNHSEGYSRSSNKDQVRFYEYSLGSAREARGWYWKSRYVLGEEVAMHRIQLLTQIIRHRLRIIPAERGRELHEDPPPYLTDSETVPLDELLNNVPMSPGDT
jgi:four helix bundle protein